MCILAHFHTIQSAAQTKSMSFPRFTVHTDCATQLLYNALADRKPQAGAMHKRIQLYKTVEYLSLHFRLNAKARIGHIKTQMSFIHLIISYTYTSRSGELDGIVDKVGYD